MRVHKLVVVVLVTMALALVGCSVVGLKGKASTPYGTGEVELEKGEIQSIEK